VQLLQLSQPSVIKAHPKPVSNIAAVIFRKGRQRFAPHSRLLHSAELALLGHHAAGL